jgi:hypothetical protein
MLATGRVDVLVLSRKLRPRGVYLSTHLFGSCLQSALFMMVAELIFARPVSGPCCFKMFSLCFTRGVAPVDAFPFRIYVLCFGASVMASVTPRDRS